MKGRNKIPELLLVFVGFYIFFLLTLTANFSAPHDSIGYLMGIITGEPLFHQHHLLYHFTAHNWLLFIQKIFPDVKDFFLVESFSALWGTGSLAIVYSFFRNRFHLNILTSVFGTAVIAFSYGIWFYSVNIEVYATPLFFLLLALYILTKRVFTRNDVWKVAILHSAAILFHQVNILLVVVVVYKLWSERRNVSFFYSMALYMIIGLILVGGLYFYIGWIVEDQNTFSLWIRWMQGYTQHDAYWQPLGIKTLFNVAVGFSHAFIGGHYLFQLPVIDDYINSSLSGHGLHDELYLSRNISRPLAIVLGILTILLAIFIVSLLIKFIKHYNKIASTHKAILTPLLLCFITYSIFFCFWMPEILEFWILQSILFWILMIGSLSVVSFPFRLKASTGVALLSILLFSINFFGSIMWLRNIKNDWYFTRVEHLTPVVTNKDIVVLQDGWILQDFLRYYSRAYIISVPWKDSSWNKIDSAVNKTLSNKGKVYIYPEHNSKYVIPETKYIDSLKTVHAKRLRIFRSKDPVIWIIE